MQLNESSKTILAFDTSSQACSVALLHQGEMRSIHQIAPRQQAKLILPMIQELLSFHSLSLKNIDVIAYGKGPGSFTGVRIAESVAQTLSFALDKPIISISSLRVIAQTAYLRENWEQLCIGLEAGMDQIHWAAYQINQSGIAVLIGDEEVTIPDQIQIEPIQKASRELEWYGIGDAWIKYKTQLQSRIGFNMSAVSESLCPSAEALLMLAFLSIEI